MPAIDRQLLGYLGLGPLVPILAVLVSNALEDAARPTATHAAGQSGRSPAARRQARYRARHGADYRQRHREYMVAWRAAKAAERQAATG